MRHHTTLLLALTMTTSLSHAAINGEPSLEDRVRGMIWGQLVADAASLGAHWIYDPAKMEERFPDGVEPFAEPTTDHYHKGRKPGEFTLYGDATLLVLRSVAETRSFSATDFGSRFVTAMTPGSYDGYVDHATTLMFDNYEAWQAAESGEPFDFQQGVDDNQMASATSVAPIVAAHFKDPVFLEVIERFVRVRQVNSEAIVFVKFEALVLRALLQGVTFDEAVARALTELPESTTQALVAERLGEAQTRTGGPTAVTAELGQSCPLPESIPASAYTFSAAGESYERVILATLQAGGENAGRACVVGAWYGAAYGVDSIPEDWRKHLAAHDEIEALVERIVERIDS